MAFKITRLRINRRGDEVTVSAESQSARGTPFVVRSVKGTAPKADKQKRNAEMARLVAEALGRDD